MTEYFNETPAPAPAATTTSAEHDDDEYSHREYYRRLVLIILRTILTQCHESNIDVAVDGVELQTITQCIQFDFPEHAKTKYEALRLLSCLTVRIPDRTFPVFVNILQYFHSVRAFTQNQMSLPILQQVLMTALPLFELTPTRTEVVLTALIRSVEDLGVSMKRQFLRMVIAVLNIPTILPRTLALYLHLYPTDEQTKDSSVEFCHGLLSEFEPLERLDALLVLIDNTYWGKNFGKSKILEVLPCLAPMTSKASRLWKANVATMLMRQLNAEWNHAELPEDFYEHCLLLFRSTFVCLHDMGKRLNTKFSDIGKTFEGCLHTLQFIIPDRKFAKVLLKLFNDSEKEVRLRALDLACSHIVEKEFSKGAKKTYVKLATQLQTIFTNEAEDIRIRKVAVSCVEAMTKFGNDYGDKIISLTPVLLTVVSHADLQNHVITTLTAMINHYTTAKTMPILNSICKTVLDLSEKLFMLPIAEVNPNRVACYIELFTSLIRERGKFVTPYLAAFLATATHPTLIQLTQDNILVENLTKDFTKQLGTLESRHVVTVMEECYQTIATDGRSIIQLFSLLGRNIQTWTKRDTERRYEPVFTFLIAAFNLRVTHDLTNAALIEDVEQSVIEALLSLIMKLKPSWTEKLLKRFIEWTGLPQSTYFIPRTLTFYRFMEMALIKFEDLFSSFFSMAFEVGVSCLMEEISMPASEENGEPPRKRRKLNATSECELQSHRQNIILRSFRLFFQLEEENNFMNVRKFDLVLEPLLSQIPKALILQQKDYLDWIEQTFIPTLQAFADTADQTVHLMSINNQLVKYTRHQDNALVRLAAADCIVSLFKHCGKRYLDNITENVRVLDELLQDSDDRMELRCSRLINVIEEVTGDKIDNYLK